MTKNVKFDENPITPKHPNSKNTGLVNFLIEKRIVKNTQQASLVLLITAVILSSIAALLLSQNQNEKTIEYQPDPEVVL